VHGVGGDRGLSPTEPLGASQKGRDRERGAAVPLGGKQRREEVAQGCVVKPIPFACGSA
jgi:hypothetical protein